MRSVPHSAALRFAAVLLLVLGLSLSDPPAALAASIAVTTTDDEQNGDGDCSLREAIAAANQDRAFGACPAGSGSDTITVPAGIYLLTFPEDPDGSVDLDITSVISIRGAGATRTIIDADGADAVVDVLGGATATIQHVAITGAGGEVALRNAGTLTLGNTFFENDRAVAIRNSGRLTLNDSTLQRGYRGLENSGTANLLRATLREHSNERGGAILNHGTLSVARSTIVNNYGDSGGGGIANYGTATINDRTLIRGNSSEGESDASGGGVYNSGTLTIDNATLSGNRADFGGALFNTATGSVTISRSELSGNSTSSDGRALGGAIANFGTLAISDSTLKGNRNWYGDGWGGAIYNGGALTLLRSTLSGNRAEGQDDFLGGHGGALANGFIRISDRDEPGLPGGAHAVITNSTLSGNSADVDGGAIFNQADAGPSTVWLNSVTIVGNSADADTNGTGDGGGAFNGPYGAGHRIRLHNTILAGDSDRGGQAPECAGQLSSYGYNLVRNLTGCTLGNIATGNIIGADPKLGPLRTNGGATLTHALLAGSPAIDAANPAAPGSSDDACPTTDQRRYRRPTDGDFRGGARCDIGAFERRSSPAPAQDTAAPSETLPFDPPPATDEPVPAELAPAATEGTLIVVTTTADELHRNGQCSLREAIRAANWDIAGSDCPAGNGADTISLLAGTYTLVIEGVDEQSNRTGDLDIVHRLTITGGGPSQVQISGAGLDRVFEVRRAAVVALNGVVIQRGAADGLLNNGSLAMTNVVVRDNQPSGVGNSGSLEIRASTVRDNQGFGIRSEGALTLASSRVLGNDGRGIALDDAPAVVRDSLIEGNRGGVSVFSGTLTLANSTINDNSAEYGAGLYNRWGTVTISGSTLSNNRALDRGGGIYTTAAVMRISNSTISGNLGQYAGGIFNTHDERFTGIAYATVPGIVYLSGATVTNNIATDVLSGAGGVFNDDYALGNRIRITHTIIAGNNASFSALDCFGRISSYQYNLIGSTTGCSLTSTTNNQLNAAPVLGPLQHNGGPTRTHLPLTGSPAIDRGGTSTSGSSACPATDQRGVRRPEDGDGNGSRRCDIGSVERRPGESDEAAVPMPGEETTAVTDATPAPLEDAFGPGFVPDRDDRSPADGQ
jgi:CSLREA domain-containing protein